MNTLMPTKSGQICKIISAIADMEPEDVYILVEDPMDFDEDDDVLVVNLKDLQRNVRQPDRAERIPVTKNELVLVGEDLASYIHDWNKTS